MASRQYKLSLGDEAYGPGDIREITVQDEGTVPGPQSPNWQPEYMLVKCLNPTSYRGQELTYLVLSPRHKGTTLIDIRQEGGAVAVGRILPGIFTTKPQAFAAHEVEYWAVGKIDSLAV
jgi:hypothetical protein